jgi:hypothetical protein
MDSGLARRFFGVDPGRKVITIVIFLRDQSTIDQIGELRGRYFRPPYPADTIVEVASPFA